MRKSEDKSVGVGAIVVIGREFGAFGSTSPFETGQSVLLPQPLACVDILGRSTVARAIERFARNDVDTVTILSPEESFCGVPAEFAGTVDTVNVRVVTDVFSAITQQLQEYSQNGVGHSFVASANMYAEADLLDLFYFHREARQTVTRGFDREGALELWVVDCAKAQQSDIQSLLTRTEEPGTAYFIRDYVSRLQHLRDVRRLVSDALCGRCSMRPPGREIKPGIWVEEGAEIHRRARIVAPAYLASGSKVKEDTLITRCSSIEKDCYVDCGTVIEDSSILANTHIGIWLDVCHAVASGNKLLSLEHDVVVEISDPSVMRSNSPDRRQNERAVDWNREGRSSEQQIVAAIQQEQPPTRETCRLEPILSRGD
jgi:hypothetical protein